MMNDMPAFQDLLRNTASYPNSLAPVELHGFITGVILGPDDTQDAPILSTVYGFTAIERIDDYIELGEWFWGATDEIAETLIDASFDLILRTDGNSQKDLTLWLQGFNKAVGLNEAGWEALDDTHVEVRQMLEYIHSLANPEIARDHFGVEPVRFDTYQQQAFTLLPKVLLAVYQECRMDSPTKPIDLTIEDLPSISAETLARQSDDELLETLLSKYDLLPRNVVDEAIRRGQPMAQRLRRHLEDPANWTEETPASHWWGLIHAVFILGYLTGEDATQGLLNLIRRMDQDYDLDLWEWLDGYWPVLFRNKRSAASQELHLIAFDKNLDWQPRVTALECLLEAAQAESPVLLDEMLQRIAAAVTDEADDWDFRIIASHNLIDFPREAHRPILEKLVDEQTRRNEIHHYYKSDVNDAYAGGEDRPEWEHFDDPLKFYDPENILKRQRRWIEEDSELFPDDPVLDEALEHPDYDDDPTVTPFVRETPKVGRNDPCPCGSGKKYKKCCLKKLH